MLRRTYRAWIGGDFLHVKSVVIKIGTNALSDSSGRLDDALIGHFAEQVAGLMRGRFG